MFIPGRSDIGNINFLLDKMSRSGSRLYALPELSGVPGRNSLRQLPCASEASETALSSSKCYLAWCKSAWRKRDLRERNCDIAWRSSEATHSFSLDGAAGEDAVLHVRVHARVSSVFGNI